MPRHTRSWLLRRTALGVAAGGVLGSVGALVRPGTASAGFPATHKVRNDPQTILNVARTAEVLATIVNTVGAEKNLFPGDAVTQRNIAAAAREELVHHDVLVTVGAKSLADKIWVPDAVFASRSNLLNTLEVGDQIFVNAYLLGTLEFGFRGQGDLAAVAAEFMGVEAVHRALARQSNGKLGNDRVFMKFDQKEEAPDAPNKGQPGFEKILGAVAQLQAAGFGFGAQGATPGQFYDFAEVRKRTPNDPDLNTMTPDPD